MLAFFDGALELTREMLAAESANAVLFVLGDLVQPEFWKMSCAKSCSTVFVPFSLSAGMNRHLFPFQFLFQRHPPCSSPRFAVL